MRQLRSCPILLVAILFSACSPGKIIIKDLEVSSKNLKHHAGFVLYDLEKKKTLVSINGEKYFTPASNTKIFTLYAGLKILGDSVPALRWISRNDSLIFSGTGDPSFLYPNTFQNQKTFNFLRSRPEKLIFSEGNFFENGYGPGWAWDDYQDHYQTERSTFPIYGNRVTVMNGRGVEPSYFNNLTIEKIQSPSTGRSLSPNPILRDRFSNTFFVTLDSFPSKLKIEIPFITSNKLTAQLLTDTLNREVGTTFESLPVNAKTWYSIPTDSLYKVMMKASDNLIAEQVLLMCSQSISDSLKIKIAIDKVMRDFLSDLPDTPVWVDGSGLSRYNQFTPYTIVKLWEKIYETVPQQRLFPLLATNGQAGTLKNVLSTHPPFIFGKSGGLSNNYCLSGYLVTKKNRLLIFSSMSANFVSPTREVRGNLEKILTYVYEKY